MPAGCSETDALDYAKLFTIVYTTDTPQIDAIGYFFYCNPADVGKGSANVGIDYAPEGDWSKAGDTPTGDHSTHDWRMTYATGVPCP